MIQVSNFFALPVFASKLEGFDAHAPELLSRIAKLREAGQGLKASNQGAAFHTARDFHVAEDSATHWLSAALLAFGKEALTPLIEPRATRPWELSIVHCWAISTSRGGWLTPHSHFPSPWVGVLYLDAEHAVSKNPQDVSGKLELLCPFPLAETFGVPPSIPISPQDGMAVIFPGALQHLVHPHVAERERVSVSFNLAVRPR